MDNSNKHVHPTFADILNNAANVKAEPAEHKIIVKRWRSKDKYPCPKCGKKVGMPDYLCIPCNVKIKPVMNF